MSYIDITKTREDGSAITYRTYKRSKWIAFFLALLLGGIGAHWFYTRHTFEGFVMLVIAFVCLYMVPAGHLAIYIPSGVAMLMAFYYLMISKENFDKHVNAR
jgi:TM2 domain-containing membrane protein YozV